ncbi:N-6 DNA methylase [Streptomyces sp. ACA25]|uniref:N-6 DNA methylase n=1 Tax=Streptomyces sp. ACA25 TaxID=3022596 RepID=UPI002306DE5D|nr:N-6 DNA methylase [Streptomyces sp. ACA25]MDB1087219.1 N-6 DNA methylase [Streptomyces sp. ACA25]
MTAPQAEVTAAGIARLAGVGRAAVSNWRRRHPHFPRPVGGTDSSPTFALAEVEQWLRDHGKLIEVPLNERAWQLLAADPAGPAETLCCLGEQLLHGDRPAGAGPLADAVAALAAESSPADAFAFLLERYLDTHSRQFTLTPRPTAELMAALAGPTDSVLDPACGSGALLAAARGHGDATRPAALHGQDSDPVLARLCGLRLALRDPADVRIRTGDSLLADAFPGAAVGTVLCHPPFNERHWGHDELVYDDRWEYGLPARAESELAWVQHALARLRPGGTAVLLMPPAAASRRTGRRIRATLLRRGALRAVLALPAGAAPPHSLPLHLWILVKPGGAPAPEPRLLVVDTATAHRSTGGNPLDRPALSAALLDAWSAFTGPGEFTALTGLRRALPVMDLLDDEVDLAPARHLPPSADLTGGEALTRVQHELRATLRSTHDLAPEVPGTDTPAPGPRWSSLTIGELARTGALELHQPGGGPEPEPRPGDVVVPLLPGDPARVLTGAGPDGAPLGRHVCLLRPDPDLLDAWFLAGFLRGTGNTRQAGSYASSATRIDIRRLKVPRLPLEAQQQYGRRFRELAAFEDALRQAAELGHRLVQGVVDGYTEGTLPPG